MEIIEKNKNPLLNREEIVVMIKENSTPSKASLKTKLAEHFKKSEGLIIIEKVNSNFGTKEVKVYSKIYDDEKSKEKFEIISKKRRTAIKKAAEESAKKESEESQSNENTEGGSE